MKDIPNKWLARKDKNGYLELIVFEDSLNRKPKGWKFLAYCYNMSYRDAKNLAEELLN